MTKGTGKATEIQTETFYADETNARYANRVQIFLTNSDLVLDFILMEPTPDAKGKPTLQSRIILSPQQAKIFSTILLQNIAKFEEIFGSLKTEPAKQ